MDRSNTAFPVASLPAKDLSGTRCAFAQRTYIQVLDLKKTLERLVGERHPVRLLPAGKFAQNAGAADGIVKTFEKIQRA